MMRVLNGSFPTEIDMDETGMEITLLRRREDSMPPEFKEMFQNQMKSAERQYRFVRSELGPSRPQLSIGTRKLQQTIAKRWEQLNATLMMAEAYCS